MRKMVNILHRRFGYEWAWRLFVVISFVVPIWTMSLTLSDDNEWDLLPSIWIESYSGASRLSLRAMAVAECDARDSKPFDWLEYLPYRNCVEFELNRLQNLESNRRTALRVEWNMIFVGMIVDLGTKEWVLWEHLLFWPLLFILIIVHIITPFLVIPFLIAKVLDYLAGGFFAVK